MMRQALAALLAVGLLAGCARKPADQTLNFSILSAEDQTFRAV